MISKIDPRRTTLFGINFPSPPPRSPVRPDFEYLLETRLSGSKPLDLMMIEFLNRTLEMLSSRDTKEDDDFFATHPISFNIPALLLQKDLSKPVEPPHEQMSPSHSGLDRSNESRKNGEDPPSNGPEEVSKVLHAAENQGAGTAGDQVKIDVMINEASQKYGVEPALISAVITAESGGEPHALSPAGAQGLMQLMPKTAAELGVMNPFDPADNIMGGAHYLRQLLDRYRGNLRLALAAYNWGMGNVEKRPQLMPKETRNYVAKVENLYRTYLSSKT